MEAFRHAMEALDVERLVGLLAADVRWYTPVAAPAFAGREHVSRLLEAVLAAFDDFRYLDECTGAAASSLLWSGRVGAERVGGIDYLRTDEAGQVTEWITTMRPLAGLLAVAERVGPKLAAASAVDG